MEWCSTICPDFVAFFIQIEVVSQVRWFTVPGTFQSTTIVPKETGPDKPKSPISQMRTLRRISLAES